VAKSKHQRQLAQADLRRQAQGDLFAQAPRTSERNTALANREAIRVAAEEAHRAWLRDECQNENYAVETTLQPGDVGMLYGRPCTVLKVGFAMVLVQQAGSEDHWVGGWWITEREPKRGRDQHSDDVG
jgi:hypothetical protein